jgi:hypothetical protein
MRRLRVASALAAVLLLGACAAASVFAPTATPANGTPYAGLNDSSYGPRSAAQWRECNPEARSGRLAAVAAVAARPAQGLMKIDATLQSLDLARHFGDPTGADHPPVAVLSHAPDGIVFWHITGRAPLAHVAAAAKAWCGSQQRGTLYRGSASHCPAPQRGLTGAPVVLTYAISAYACTGRP